MLGSKGQKAVHACMIRLLNLGPAKHEKAAIYAVNQRISNIKIIEITKDTQGYMLCVFFLFQTYLTNNII